MKFADFKKLSPGLGHSVSYQLYRSSKYDPTAELDFSTCYKWQCEVEATLPTLAELFSSLPAHLAFNIELKYAERLYIPKDKGGQGGTTDADVSHMLEAVLPVVDQATRKQPRAIIFSSFDPNTVAELRKRDPDAIIFFLTEGKDYGLPDQRMNGLPNAREFAA